MDFDWFPTAVAAAAVGAWFLVPYLTWRDCSARPLEAHVARTSFQCPPGELVPPAWRAPELALSVVVPAFNEEHRLPQMLEETLTYLESRAAGGPLSFSYEVIVVDDGSTDGTFAAALAAHCRRSTGRGELRVMRLTANRGKGFAVRAGMLVARGQLLLMADADGATSIRDIERLEQALSLKGDDGGVHMAFGSRHHLKAEASAKRSPLRRIISLGLEFVVWVLVGRPLRDTQCGFKLFRAGVGKHLFASLHSYGWAFDVELVIMARMLGKRIAEVPVTWVEMPGSKLNLLVGALAMLRDIVLLRVLFFLGLWQPLMMA
mmetsp:Transcript_72704/g.168475  ORF Transcript_72704/g.168475 Transcript_72704/m.168475 type:complete len:319 (-) Transcript_72704:94-1050(-)